VMHAWLEARCDSRPFRRHEPSSAWLTRRG